jgi:RNA polymerase sigma-70 factor (ECF subfamily)
MAMASTKENTKTLFESWVNQFSDELFSWAYHKTSSKETAEDLVQDTFLSAFHKIDTFEGKSSPKTWLFSILNNKSLTQFFRAA